MPPIDTQPPTATITLADAVVGIGGHTTATVVFSEAVTGLSVGDFDIIGVTVSGLQTTDNITYTVRLDPGINGNIALSLPAGSVTDAAGNPNLASPTVHFLADLTRPTATVAIDTTELHAGETATVTFGFAEAVTGFDATDVTVANGSLSDLASSDGGATWTATYTPTAGVDDAATQISLDLAGVVDIAHNAGVGVANSPDFAINTIRPTATIIVADNALKAGETSLVTVTFSEAVTGFDNNALHVDNGALSNLSTSDGGITWTATLTPDAGVTDLSNLIALDNTRVSNAAGNTGDGETDSNNYAIDTARPTATITLDDHALGIGHTAQVTITFSEAVPGFTNAHLTTDNGTLSAVASSDGGVTYTATVTPISGITHATNTIVLDNTGIQDAAGNSGVGTTISDNYALDATPPTAAIHVAGDVLNAGETANVTFTFSEAVTGLTTANVTVEHGALSNLSTHDGGITWTATLTPDAHLTDATNVITLDNTGIADLAGNAGSGTTSSDNYSIDTNSQPPSPPSQAPPTDLPGTAGPDTIIGNDLDNHINAGDGANTVMGGAGADTILGGADTDLLQGNTGADSMAGGAGTDTVLGGQGDDALQGATGKDLLFGDKGNDSVFGGQDSDTVQGGEGNDVVSGDKGDDVLMGGQGDDVVLGGDGNDFLSGDRGADTLTGGAGADTFHTFAAAGKDLVTDFHASEGDRVMLDPGTVYTVAQVGADTVISMDGGGQMVLANVQLSSLSAGWIFEAA